MNRTTFGLATITIAAILMGGCVQDSGSDQDKSAENNETTSTEAGPETADEQKAVKNHDALAPEDYSGRILSLSDVPDTLSVEE